MAYITPSTMIDLMKVAMDPTYTHVRYFASDSDKDTFFDSKVFRSLTANTYQNYTKGTIRIAVTPASVLGCNYIRFRNTGYENKNYYAFVESITDISNECVEITYRIDVFMTYWMDYNTPTCFVERSHTRTDVVGDNLETEPIQAELKTWQGVHTEYYTLNDVVMVTTPSQWASQTIRLINGQLMVVNIDLFDLTNQSSADLFVALIQNMAQAGELDRIISLKQLPSWAYSTTDPTTNYLPTRTGTITWNRSAFISANGAASYTPRNKKLYTSQFSKLRVRTSDNETIDLKPECFSNSGQNVSMEYTETCNTVGEPSVMVKFTNYSDSTKENRVYISNFPDIMLTKDAWSEYLNRSGASVGLGLISAAVSALGSKSGATDMLQTGGNLITTMADTKRRPASTIGTPNPSMPLALGEFGWAVYRFQVSAEEAQNIDEYFDMYGYAVNAFGLPTRKIRDKYTYIKTKDLRVNGEIPVDAVEAISNAYNNGVTFWADNSNFMNYALAVRQANVA